MQKTKLPNLITILVITLITIVMWIGFSIYRAITTPPEPSVSQTVSATLDPTLDTGTVSKIESNLFFSGSQIPQTTFSASPSPAASAAPKLIPITTPIATLSATPATPSAQPTVFPTPTATP